ncbi:hypothetical protein M405DRAFT_860356 [Rhizopogon salebrosus TDB-379]|nr:hypothetical protein M405DRAFT_860356 [Rhizopogon salebrosus TDB-379]
MATLSLPPHRVLMAVWCNRLISYTNVSVAAFWTYDLMLRFQEDAAFLAQAKWNVAKFLYIAARYMPFLMASVCLVFDQVLYTGNVDCQILGDLATGTTFLGTLTLFCAECIFVLRTCAMWKVASYLRRVMFIVMSVVTIAGLIVFCTFRGRYTHVLHVPACKALEVAKEPRLLGVALLVLLILEFALIILTVLKATQSRGSTLVPLLTLLLKHNMFYHGCGFLFSVVNLLCVALLKYEYHTFFLTAQITIHTILATRMQYQLWDVDRARRCHPSEQYPVSLLLYPTEVTATV